MDKTLGNNIYDWLIELGLKHNNAVLVKGLIIVTGLLMLSYLVFIITQKIIVKLFNAIAKRTETTWDDIMVERRVFHRLAYIAPALLIHSLTPTMLAEYHIWSNILQASLKIYMVFIVIIVLDAFFNTIIDIYQDF